ncbi:hypothetical protein HY768_06060 [candidate division TA06 bacterium]|uniref:PatA-like N-terminal domain-containing protein n=1 Tax=candidate division TA06 bacterium TaxID=2250710 RepID=A0A933I8X5_UNCT6|nr:hypothetical protein [candidate division TA06 bacterium]
MAEIITLGRVQFGEVVAKALKERWSGVLTIESPEFTEYVEFKNGSIGGFSSAERKQLLGEILTAGGHISEEDLDKAIATQKAKGGRIGDILVEMDLITRQRIEEVLAIHQMSVLAQSLSAKDSELSFEPGLTLADKG